MVDEPEETHESPGWDAIDKALRPIYGDREPYHVGTVVPYALGGPDPIHGISAYKNAEPTLHWHFVTYGFSELWAKESSDPSVSGFGFELTFRVACSADEQTPPNWAFNFLQNLGRYVFSSGHGFGVGHTLPLNGPIEQGSPTLIHAASFTADPQLPEISTPNGRVEFLQIVGLTTDELNAISSWDAAAFLELRRQTDPLLLTDLARSSWLAERAFADEVLRRTNAEGSSCDSLYLVLTCAKRWTSTQVSIQSIAVDTLKRRLLGRLPFGRELTLYGEKAAVVFEPATETRWKSADQTVTITLRKDHLAELVEALKPHAGRYPIPGLKNTVLQVLRTEIKDRDGKVVDIVD